MSMIDVIALEGDLQTQTDESAGGSDGSDTPLHEGHDGAGRHERLFQIIEALLLAIITVVTAWAGFHGARWETTARLSLSHSTALQQQANDQYTLAAQNRALDAQNFQVWFTAYTQHEQAAADVAMRRFRADYKVAFGAWLATHPFTSLVAAASPQSMPQYQQPNNELAIWLDDQSAAFQHSGNQAGAYGDEYVRLTLMLAGVLFLVAISGQFKLPAARYALLAVGFFGVLTIAGLLTTIPLSH